MSQASSTRTSSGVIKCLLALWLPCIIVLVVVPEDRLLATFQSSATVPIAVLYLAHSVLREAGLADIEATYPTAWLMTRVFIVLATWVVLILWATRGSSRRVGVVLAWSVVNTILFVALYSFVRTATG